MTVEAADLCTTIPANALREMNARSAIQLVDACRFQTANRKTRDLSKCVFKTRVRAPRRDAPIEI
jgi:hypothetical protein